MVRVLRGREEARVVPTVPLPCLSMSLPCLPCGSEGGCAPKNIEVERQTGRGAKLPNYDDISQEVNESRWPDWRGSSVPSRAYRAITVSMSLPCLPCGSEGGCAPKNIPDGRVTAGIKPRLVN